MGPAWCPAPASASAAGPPRRPSSAAGWSASVAAADSAAASATCGSGVAAACAAAASTSGGCTRTAGEGRYPPSGCSSSLGWLACHCPSKAAFWKRVSNFEKNGINRTTVEYGLILFEY